jgi:iron complex transport system substrate-binding protein
MFKTGALILTAVLLLAGCAAPDSAPVASLGSAPERADEAAGSVCGSEAKDLAALLQQPARSSVEVSSGPTAFCIHPLWQPSLPATETKLPMRLIGIDISGRIAASLVQLGLASNLVGRDTASNQAELAQLPQVTGQSHVLSLEAILATEPDLIITDGTLGPSRVLAQLSDLGIEIVELAADVSLEASFEQHVELGARFGLAELAEQQVAEARAALATLTELMPAVETSGKRTLFLYLRSGGLYLMLNPSGPAGDLISSLGLEPIEYPGGDSSATAAMGVPLNAEALAALNPDLLIVMKKGLSSVGETDGLLRALPALSLTRAGAERRILVVEDELAFRFGVWAPAVIEAMARQLWALEVSGAS